MHNIDRTALEMGYEGGYGSNEYGYAQEFESPYMGEYQPEYGGGYQTEYGYQGEYGGGYQGEFNRSSPFSEEQEMALAAELLNVSNEMELDQFFGKLFRGASKFLKSGVGKSLVGMVKPLAKAALPTLGGALGNLVLPGIGGMIGGQLAGSAGSMLGLELEGLSQEDQEFEVARQLVRLGGAAATNAAAASTAVPPQQAAQTAVAAAASQYAPGLLNPAAAGPAASQPGRCRCRR